MRGINGRNGFIPYPGIIECGEDFDTWAAKFLRAQSGSVVGDHRERAGGGPEVQNDMAEQLKRPSVVRGTPVDYSSGVARMVPTPEEARRALEAARRAASGYVEPMVPSVNAESGWEARVRRENGGSIPFAESSSPIRGVARIGPTPEEHRAALGHLDGEARQAYMSHHRLRWEVGGILVQDPPPMTITEESAPYSPLGRVSMEQRAAASVADGSRLAGELLGSNGAESQSAVGTNYDVGALHTASSPWKMFSRATITAIIRAERTRPQTTGSLETLNRLLSTFENLE